MNTGSAKSHYWIRSLILIGFAWLLADLIFSERLNQYLAPRLHMLSYVTLSILILLAVVSIRQALFGPAESPCDCEEAHKLPRSRLTALVVYTLFALPLVMGFALPDKILGSSLAEKRGVTLLTGESNWVKAVKAGAPSTDDLDPVDADAARPIPSTSQGEGRSGADDAAAVADTQGFMDVQQEALEAGSGPGGAGGQKAGSVQGLGNAEASRTDEEIRSLFHPEQFGGFYTDMAVMMYKQPVIQLDDKLFLDGLTTMELFAKEFAGKELETMGFVYREAGFDSEQFVVARFSVSCCTADATVFGILVESPDGSRWEKDSWVKVRGKLDLRKMDGYDMLVLKNAAVTPVEAPKDPYVYYSFDAVPSP